MALPIEKFHNTFRIGLEFGQKIKSNNFDFTETNG